MDVEETVLALFVAAVNCFFSPSRVNVLSADEFDIRLVSGSDICFRAAKTGFSPRRE